MGSVSFSAVLVQAQRAAHPAAGGTRYIFASRALAPPRWRLLGWRLQSLSAGVHGMRSTLVCGLLAWAPVSLACDCMALPLPERAKLSTDVFLAEVAGHEALVSIDLVVLESFKGERRNRVRIATGQNMCDYFLGTKGAEPGSRFLIFMTRTPQGNSVSRCHGSAPEGEAAPDLKILRARTIEIKP